MEAELVEIACPVCAATQSRHMFAARDYVHRVTNAAFGVRRCDCCGVGFLSPRPKPADIPQYYPQDFYWIYENSMDAPLTAEDLLRTRAPQIAAKLERMSHLRQGRLLDVGAMKGEFLHAAGTHGWQVQGVEFTQQPPNLFGVSMRYGELLDMDFAASHFDCITMWAVLEHVYEPAAYVRKVAELLAPGGTFIGVVTNFNSIQARWLHGDDYPRHLTMFTRRSLTRMLRETGLEPVRMWTDQKLFGGKVRGLLPYVVKRILGYSVDEALFEMRDSRGDPEAFCCKFRGRSSAAMKWVSRVDNMVLWLPEQLLDLAGLGFNLGFEARKTVRP